MPDAPERGLLLRLARGFARLIEWREIDRVLFIAVVCLVFVCFYAVVEYAYLVSPERASWADPAFVRFAFRMQIGLYVTGWSAIIAIALWHRARGRSSSRWLIHVASQFYFAGFAMAAVWFGQFTNMFGAVVLLAGVVFGLGLFRERRRAILLGTASFTAIVVGAGVLERAGLLAYAPMFQGSPFAGGRLSFVWLATFGGVTFLMLLVVAGVNALIIGLWHDREARLARANRLIRRYVPSQLADQLLSDDFAASDRPQRRKVTILFSDVEGFTSTADQLEPEDLARLLDEYLSEMTSIAEIHGGTVSDIAGDGLMILFGAPHASEDREHAVQAVRTALAMQERMAHLREKWFHDGIQSPFRIRIGVNTGVASVGSFGSEGRKVFSAIGNQTNLAARIQGACPPGRVWLSHATWALVRDEIRCEPQGEVEAKGIHYAVRVYEVSEAVAAPGVAAVEAP